MSVNIAESILWPSLIKVRRKYCNNIEEYVLSDSFKYAHKISMALIDELHREVKAFKNTTRIHYAVIIEGCLRHSPKIASYFWKQRHCIVEVMFIQDGVDSKWYIDAFADVISLQIHTALTPVDKFSIKKTCPWYLYPDEKNPEYSKWSRFIIHKTHKRINPVAWCQDIWAVFSDMIRSYRLGKLKRKKEKNEEAH